MSVIALGSKATAVLQTSIACQYNPPVGGCILIGYLYRWVYQLEIRYKYSLIYLLCVYMYIYIYILSFDYGKAGHRIYIGSNTICLAYVL